METSAAIRSQRRNPHRSEGLRLGDTKRTTGSWRVAYTQTIRVRYGEVDQQGVVFNAHYLAYLDDVADSWLRTLDADFEATGWELMLRRADLTWHGPAGVHDELVVTAEVVRWGTTSFDVAFDVRVEDSVVLTATVYYVGVSVGDHVPMAPPPAVRAHLSG